MISRRFNLLAVLGILFQLYIICQGRRTWEHDILSFEPTSSDESKVNVSGRTERVGRGEKAISMVMDWKYDTDETTMVQLLIYSCESGRDEDYSELPYKIPPSSLYDFLENNYQHILYKNFGDCSNIPNIEGKFQPPWPKNLYEFKNCMTNGEGFPDIMPSGYYKLVFKISGQVEVTFTLIAKVSTKLI